MSETMRTPDWRFIRFSRRFKRPSRPLYSPRWVVRSSCTKRPSKGREQTDLKAPITAIGDRSLFDPIEFLTQSLASAGLICTLGTGLLTRECQLRRQNDKGLLSQAFRATEQASWAILPRLTIRSGPTAQKALQWMSSRVDLFGAELCTKLADNQVHAPRAPFGEFLTSIYFAYDNMPKPLRFASKYPGQTAYCLSLFDAFTQKEALYRPDPYYIHVDRDSYLVVCKEDVIGSGVVADVYLAFLVEPLQQEVRKVAWKVQRRGIQRRMLGELNVLSNANNIAMKVPFVKHMLDCLPMDINSGITEFCHMMKPQLNMLFEMHNLERFHSNFTPGPAVKYSDPFDYGWGSPVHRLTLRDLWIGVKSRLVKARTRMAIDDQQRLRIRRYGGCVTVPEVFKGISGQKALVMSYEEGIPLGKMLHSMEKPDQQDIQFFKGSGSAQMTRSDQGSFITVRDFQLACYFALYKLKQPFLRQRYKREFQRCLKGMPDKSFPPLSAKTGYFVTQMMLDAMMQMIVKDQFVHSDLHSGNILLRKATPSTQLRYKQAAIWPLPKWELVMVDMGLAYPLSPSIRRNMFDLIWSYLSEKNFKKIAQMMVFREPQGSNEQDIHNFSRDIEVIAGALYDIPGLAKRGDQTMSTCGIINALFESAFRNKIKLQNEFVQLGLSMALLDGMRSSLAPELNILPSLDHWFTGLLSDPDLSTKLVLETVGKVLSQIAKTTHHFMTQLVQRR